MCDLIQRCCRICLNTHSDHIVVLQNPSIQLHLKTCLSITVLTNDELPKSICVSCVSRLSDFYNFYLTARCSQEWLDSCIQEKAKKSTESRITVQPLPDSEYNSDSLLEFLNNTANIDEYLNNLRKEDIPCIVNMLDKSNEQSIDDKVLSPSKRDNTNSFNPAENMEIDILDSDIEIVKELLTKETEPKIKAAKSMFCFACKIKCDNLQALSQHLSICDKAQRTCSQCNLMFDSKSQMLKHRYSQHISLPFTCNCGKTLNSKDQVTRHYKICKTDNLTNLGCVYRCKLCQDVFQDRYQLYKHAKQHLLKSHEKVCDICGQTINGEEEFAKHRKEKHGKCKGVLYRCKVCQFTSSIRKEIFNHAKKHTKESSKHLCETCGRCFSSHTNLMRHSVLHGNLGYKCAICDQQFSEKKTRDEHSVQHTDLMMCDKCGKTISSYKLDVHFCE